MEDIREYLESKGCVVHTAGSGNIRMRCPWHGEAPEKPGKLYINVEDEDKWGIWFCFVCNERGNLNKLRQFYGDAPIKLKSHDYDNPLMEIAAAYYHENLLKNNEAYEYLTQERGLTDLIIIQARIGWADGNLAHHLMTEHKIAPEVIKDSGLVNTHGHDYFKNEIIFPYQNFGRAVQLRGKKIGGITRGLPGVNTMPYNADALIGEDTAVICEGEIDTLTMLQMDFPAVGVPGVHTFKEEWLEIFDEIKRVYIIFDQDPAGKSGAEKVAGKIGPRSRVVELPKKGIDVNDYYVKYGKLREDFDYLFSKAKGGILITVHQAYERWTQIEGNPNLVGLKFNIAALDRAMSYGQLPGQLVVTLARTDAGKSIDVLNKIVRNRLVDEEFTCLLISLEQTRNEVFERLHRINNFYHPGSSVIDTVNYWKNNLLIVDKNRITENELVDCIEQFCYENGRPANKIIVDYLGYYARGFGGNAKERTSEAMMGLKRIAKEFETVIETPVQANRTGEIGSAMSFDMAADAAEVEHTANIMMSLWRPEQKLQKDPGNSDVTPGDVYSQIIKSKNGGSGTIARYHFTPLTLALVPYDDPLYDMAIKERAWAGAGDTIEDVIQRRLTGSLEI